MSFWTKVREPVLLGQTSGFPLQAATGKGFLGELLGTGDKGLAAEAGRNNLSMQMFLDKASSGIPYQAAYDPSTMSMLPDVQKRLEALKMDTRGLDKFRQEAMRRNPSRWANIMLQKQAQEELGARDRARHEARSAQAQSEADLAMRGGLTSGARERGALAAQRNLLSMSQDVGRQSGLNRLQVGINDETNRISQLSQLPGFENQMFQNQLAKETAWSRAKDQDIQRAVQEAQARNEFNMKQHQAALQAQAAQQQAQATRDAGSKGFLK